jgi:ornithine cyclodeaminase/alanine dehydrogenase-like protein (mu-crystallin family)
MLILSDANITSLLSHQQIIESVEAAMRAFEKKEARVPQRLHLANGNNTLLCMPSFARHYFGTKLVSVVTGNSIKGLPVTNGAMLLNDAETGLPLALINAAKLTALRTGAVGAIGVRYLSPENETTIGLIGCGVQGLHQAVFACSVRNISRVYYLSRSNERAASLI